MSNENSNLRVGSAGAGLFVGSTEILGGGVDNIFKLHESPTSNEFQAFIIVNASSLPINLFVSYSIADNYEISIQPGSVAIISAMNSSSIEVKNTSGRALNASRLAYLYDFDVSEIYKEKNANFSIPDNGYIISNVEYEFDVLNFTYIRD